LIANVPEEPKATDFFNISKLQHTEGRMSARWISMYGTHPDDKSMFATPSTAFYLEGSSFLGRILISMSIAPCEIPKLMKGP
jgi:hypothetical protein